MANTQGVGHGRERRIYCADAGKETGINHVKVIQLMRFAVLIEHRAFWVRTEPACSRLMSTPGNTNLILEIEIARDQMVVHVEVTEHRLQLLVELLLGH